MVYHHPKGSPAIFFKWVIDCRGLQYFCPQIFVLPTEQWKKGHLIVWCMYREWNFLPRLCGDYFINHEIRIPIKQPGFEWKVISRCFFFVAATTTSVNQCECEGASKMSKLQRLNSLGIAEISGVRVGGFSQSFKTATIMIQLMEESG